MADVSVFGKPASQSIASAVLSSPSMTATAAPDQPEHVPADGLLKLYAQLNAIASDALTLEQDPAKAIELQRFVEFSDRALADAVNAAGSGGAPVPNTPVPAPPAPPAAAAPGMPPAAPAGQVPGMPAGPTPPGVAA